MLQPDSSLPPSPPSRFSELIRPVPHPHLKRDASGTSVPQYGRGRMPPTLSPERGTARGWDQTRKAPPAWPRCGKRDLETVVRDAGSQMNG